MKTSWRRTRTGALGLVVLALVAGACGGGDDDEASSKKQTSAQAESTTTTEALDASTSTTDLANLTTTSLSTATTARPVVRAPAPRTATAPKQSSGVVNVVAAPTTAPQQQVKRGGTLNFAFMIEAGAGFDPAYTASFPASAQYAAVFEPLVEQDLNGNLAPRLAEAVSSTDGKTWTIKLRQGLKFTDGSPLTAADFIANWKRFQDPATKSPRLGSFATWESYDQVDPLTIRVVLKVVNGQFPRTLGAFNQIVKTEQLSDPKAASERPIATGPFVVKSWKRDDTLELEKNPHYWEQGKPYLDKVVVKQIPDASQRYNSLKTGGVDCISWIEDGVQFATAKADGFNGVPTFDPIGGRAGVLRMNKPPFDDIRARRAINHLLDRDALNRTVFRGAVQNPVTLINPQSPFHDANIKLPQYDAKKAQDLLDELAKDGKPLSFTFTIPGSTWQTTAEYFQAALQAFRNVKMEIKTIPTTQSTAVLLSGDFQMFGGVFGNQPDPDTAFYNTMRSGQPGNTTTISNPELDAALDRGRTALDLPTRYAAYQTVQRIIVDQVPVLLAYNPPIGMMAKKEAVNCETSLVPTLGYPVWRDVWMNR